jgi:acetoin utilization protein AcuC
VAARSDDAASRARRNWLRAASALAGLAAAGRALPVRHEDRAVGLYVGEALTRYGFPEGHPLGADRQGAFMREVRARGLDARVRLLPPAPPASREILERFHSPGHVDRVSSAEAVGLEYLDAGDTPVFPGVYESAATIVGTAVDGLERIMRGELVRTFQAIGGLHHAGRGYAAGFCVFNDVGVVIETLRAGYGVRRVAYVDIDVHHGDGVFYAFEDDPDLVVVDIHEDGHHLYPGTGHAHETGRGPAKGAKLNIPLPPGAGDAEFARAWDRALAHLERFRPEFFLFQAGADGLRGDPLAHLGYSPAVHTLAARELRSLADRHAQGRLMAFGGGGYDRGNLAAAWSNAVAELLV